ncbi:hypothetical protein EON80_20265 [bacterium]|nr:MAG: hypothetical protein EON80_20265 [bacterium]
MWPTRANRAKQIMALLELFSRETKSLPGVAKPEACEALAWQVVASLRRMDYTQLLRQRAISHRRTDPGDEMFDPEMAAIVWASDGNLDEAFWLLFLATHFGKHGKTGWLRLRQIYSGLGKSSWTWARTSSDPKAFEAWLAKNYSQIEGGFGNHRKYETIKPIPNKGTGAIVASYIAWVGPSRSHADLVSRLVREAGNDPHSIFDRFYKSMTVARFGRLARFDFLALVGRLHLAPIEPGSAYLTESTGPRRGARLLFLGHTEDKSSDKSLDRWLVELDQKLGVGMQVLEDSLCNWQKSPDLFVHFTG